MPLRMKEWEFDPLQHEGHAFSADVMREGFNVFNHVYDRLLAVAVGTERVPVALPNTATGRVETMEMSGLMIALQLAIFHALRYAEYNEGGQSQLVVPTMSPQDVAKMAAALKRREGD